MCGGERLQLSALSGATRSAHTERPSLLDELRRAIAAASSGRA